jgi:hypothetical protein
MHTHFSRAFHLLAVSALLIGCNSSTTTTASEELAMEKLAGDQQIGSPGLAVEVAPTVKITDANGAPVSGLLVSFTVMLGGGNISGGITRTDANGVAAVGNWRLGALIGTNTLKVTAAGVDAQYFSATAYRASPGNGSL